MSSDDPLNYIVSAKSSEKVWAFYKALMLNHGFSRVTYIYSHFANDQTIGDPADVAAFSTVAGAEAEIDALVRNHSAWLQAVFDQDGAVPSVDVLTSLEDKTVFANTDDAFIRVTGFGEHAGYAIGFRGSSARTRGAVLLSAQEGVSQAQTDDIWAKHGARILLISNLMHLRMITLPHMLAEPGLTARQREVLQWVGDGKTIQDISILMGLTCGTIEKHLRLARQRLNVETTTQAVLKAAVLHLIFVPNIRSL